MSLPVHLRKKPRHIFKCTSVEQYSSLLGIHKESILVRLSTSSWIMHLGLALSTLFRGSSDLSSSEQLCPRTAPSWVIFLWRSADHTSCSCAKLSSCGVSVHLPNTSNETNLLAARCHGGRRVLLWYENCQSVEISFIKFFFVLGEEVTDKTLFLWHWSHQRACTFIFILYTGCMWADLKWSCGSCMWFYCVLMQRRRVKRWWQITPYIN